jgi:hypothetical protein
MKALHIATCAIAVACLTVAAPVAARAAVDAASQKVIKESGAAMGVAALRGVTVVRIDQTASGVGLSGTETQWLDVVTGRFAEYATLPPVEQDDGYDGNVAWNRDGVGLVWNDGSDAGKSAEITNAFVSTFALWKPNASGAEVVYRGTKSEKGRQYDVLSVTAPQSKLPVELWFDASTHQLVRQVFVNGPRVSVSTFSDFRSISGVTLPFTIHSTTSDGNNFDSKVTRVTMNPSGAETYLARPQSSVHDFSMQGDKTSTTVPFDLVENHVYLNVMLNGKGPYRFIFDTGGQNVVDPTVAKEINALGKGSAQGTGVGSGTESLSFAMVNSLQVGDAVLQKQLFAVAPVRMGFGVAGGAPVDGIIGWEVLARYITSFDYSKDEVVLTMPGDAKPPSGSHIVSFVFDGTQPQIPCTIDDIAAQCTIDTGARDTLSFYAPFLAANPKVQPSTLTANGMTGFGFGGPSFGKLGRVRTVGIGDISLSGLVADFTTQTAGAFASPFIAANIGGNLLRRFDVTFDYAHQTMALVPNAAFSQPDFYDRGGMFLINKAGSYVVADARPGTPAAEAGIAKGDVITSVDGTSTGTMSLGALRSYFLKPAGTQVHLEVTDANGTRHAVTIILRNYV